MAPGTWGSGVGVALALALSHVSSPWLYGVAVVGLVVIGVWSAGEAERQLGRSDPGQVVIDEVAGMVITVAGLHPTMTGVVVGFLLFRLLDIVKPWPARQFERLHGGLGIMADDCMAGVYGLGLMRLGAWVFPGWLT